MRRQGGLPPLLTAADGGLARAPRTATRRWHASLLGGDLQADPARSASDWPPRPAVLRQTWRSSASATITAPGIDAAAPRHRRAAPAASGLPGVTGHGATTISDASPADPPFDAAVSGVQTSRLGAAVANQEGDFGPPNWEIQVDLTWCCGRAGAVYLAGARHFARPPWEDGSAAGLAAWRNWPPAAILQGHRSPDGPEGASPGRHPSLLARLRPPAAALAPGRTGIFAVAPPAATVHRDVVAELAAN